ncbi:MAG: phosphatase PAP2 family protein [Bacteroidetes bacterium]|nr:phosphatase PAP2 family protein [Bacteroidota bacterium]MDA0904262.1 phosphatase PAP2 family protein [Bacteroidota bacterium]MDA1243216.1 phosphatase PAP2 family protein [Bacteroidota bacterium]
MLEILNDFDTALFLALNGTLPFLDRAMWWVSQPLFWIPLYAAMVWSCKTVLGTWKQRAWIAACLVLCVAGTDAVSARVLKPSVERLRPSHEPALAGEVHLVEERPGELYRGGRYGFVSSHAANHMGVAVLFGGLLGAAWSWGLLAWALLIGYSRIHLGVHYPGDVLGGFVVGWGIGALAWVLARRGQKLFEPTPLESNV